MISIKKSNYLFPITICLILLISTMALMCDAKTKSIKSKQQKLHKHKYNNQQQVVAAEEKQLFLEPESRETDPPNFVRLVIMRLIYGIATQMGMEERIAGLFNGAFAPPNAADDDFDGGLFDGILSGIGGGDSDDDGGGFFNF